MSDMEDLNVVMLIDDDLGDQKLYRRIIKRSGIDAEAICFDYAQDALDYLRQADRPRVDLIFLDINMPGMNGFEFLEAAVRDLEGWSSETVVIMLTTSAMPEDADRARSFPVVKDYLVKPLTVEQLHRAIDLVREHRRNAISAA